MQRSITETPSVPEQSTNTLQQGQAKQARKEAFISKLLQLNAYFQEATNLAAIKKSRAEHFTALIEIALLPASLTKTAQFNKHRDQFMLGTSRYQPIVKTITLEEMDEFLKDKDIVVLINERLLKGYGNISSKLSIESKVATSIKERKVVVSNPVDNLDALSKRVQKKSEEYAALLPPNKIMLLKSEELIANWREKEYQEDISKLNRDDYLTLLQKHVGHLVALQIVLNLISERCKSFVDKMWIVKQFKLYLQEWIGTQPSSSTKPKPPSAAAQEEMLREFSFKALLNFKMPQLAPEKKSRELSCYQEIMYEQYKRLISANTSAGQKEFYFLVLMANKINPLVASGGFFPNAKNEMVTRITSNFLWSKEKAQLTSVFLESLAEVTDEANAEMWVSVSNLLGNYQQLISYDNERSSIADRAETFYELLYCASELRRKIAEDLTRAVFEELSKVDTYLKQKDAIVYTESYRAPRLMHFKKMHDLVYNNTADMKTRAADFTFYQSNAPQGGRNTYPELISKLSLQEWLQVAEQPSVKQLFAAVFADLEALPEKVVTKAAEQLDTLMRTTEKPEKKAPGLFHLYTSRPAPDATKEPQKVNRRLPLEDETGVELTPMNRSNAGDASSENSSRSSSFSN